ncbi:hypothetical protein OPW41_13090 [Vibrio europaeus]|uniref:hypothetical protein n=1 Tax=Vibrio europaeus TaxID=300876 RepID=UPI00233F0835|nr:hypothetical protein [Vibrio europaeus]MDC5754790.1 hypothetical protein [Vibrio europaeus]MDC5776685.1 hypothetical protein [Vibrio europaeus]MDC5795766.1 hypothetical protein [Vibrio europaeus]MDC5798394.1 hypothetical protein [Vibrio europaeus]MDC5813458.1 hypothetical protein [Vibrio europaeus]
MSQTNEMDVTTPVDERDLTAQAAIDEMQQEEHVIEQTESGTDEQEEASFDPETSRQMLGYGLGIVEFSVGAAFDVPFEIDENVGNKWLDAATPMLQKYGPAGFAWFAEYEKELVFAMASCTLVGGCTLQVRRLRQEKALLAAKEAKETSQAQGETDEAAESDQQE